MSEKVNYLKYPLMKQFAWMVIKFIVFLTLLALVFVIGLIVGYAVLGDGNYWEIFNQDTWMHIINFVN